MKVLVLNSGSSSVKFSVFDFEEKHDQLTLLLDGELSRLGEPTASLTVQQTGQEKQTREIQGAAHPAEAIGTLLDAAAIATKGPFEAVGYRVVQPGPLITNHTRITEDVLKQLEAAADFAPLHDPDAVAIIREVISRLPNIPHIACFDTIFHQTMPEEASTYPISKNLRDRGVKRYGFHGLSCESVLRQLKAAGPVPCRMVIAHLGSGCSVTAVLDGLAIDTTMGLTPTGGVVMGTRPGDLDPGLVIYLLRQEPEEHAAVSAEHMLNHKAGLVALSQLPNDMKLVRKAAAEGNTAAVLALKVFTRSVRKAIGGFAWLMGGLDAIAFTGGIGEHDAATRTEILAGSEVLVNSSSNDGKEEGVRRIDASETRTAVFVVTAQEDLVIALHVKRLVLVEA